MGASVQERLFGAIARAQRVPVETITIDATFADLKIDSLDAINMVFEIEEEFGVGVPNEQLSSLRSIRDVAEGIERLLAAKATQ